MLLSPAPLWGNSERKIVSYQILSYPVFAQKTEILGQLFHCQINAGATCDPPSETLSAVRTVTTQHPAIILDELPRQAPCPNPDLWRPVQAYRCIFAARLNTDANIWLLGRTLPQSPRKSRGVSQPPRVSGCFAASLYLLLHLQSSPTSLGCTWCRSFQTVYVMWQGGSSPAQDGAVLTSARRGPSSVPPVLR